MSYAIKLENGNGPYLRYFTDRNRDSAPVIEFTDPGAAEEYAQDHEIKNYSIAAVTKGASADSKELIT